MPELPEVETVRQALVPVMEGRVIRSVIARRKTLRFALPDDFAGRVQGRRVRSVERRGKYMIVRLDGGTALIMHLGMSGRMRIFHNPPPAAGPHDHVDFLTETGITVRFTDARRFGFMDLVNEAGLETCRHFSALGPEPLSADFNAAGLALRLKGRKTSIKAALMDQHTVAGLGNIYACEALFRAGLSPKRSARTVQGGRAEKLAAAVKAVLLDAISAGGSSLKDHVLPSGELGYFQTRFAVYGREGEACPGCDCDRTKTGGIRRIVQAGRSTFYCPVRQR